MGRLQQQSSINAPYDVIDRRTKWMGKENIGLASKTLLNDSYEERRFCDEYEKIAQPTKTLPAAPIHPSEPDDESCSAHATSTPIHTTKYDAVYPQALPITVYPVKLAVSAAASLRYL